MPEFECVQCFACSTFQVQQKKKVKKFVCSLCGENQSVRKVYCSSFVAKDVRKVVQSLNAKRDSELQQEDGCPDFSLATVDVTLDQKKATNNIFEKTNLWEEFLKDEDADQVFKEFPDTEGQLVVFELPQQQGIKRKANDLEELPSC